jgi:hypothetical protein
MKISEFAVRYIQSGALQDIAFHLPGSESGTGSSRIARLRSTGEEGRTTISTR